MQYSKELDENSFSTKQYQTWTVERYKLLGLRRFKIADQRFEAISELEEFGAMLENVLPDWADGIERKATRKATRKSSEKNAWF